MQHHVKQVLINKFRLIKLLIFRFIQCEHSLQIITARKRSCGKVMFSQVLVCPPFGAGGYDVTFCLFPCSLPSPPPPVLTCSGVHRSGGTHPTGMHSCFKLRAYGSSLLLRTDQFIFKQLPSHAFDVKGDLHNL